MNLNEEQQEQLVLLPQVTEMLAKESYHYCADCKAHCRQLILTVEALKELNRAYASLLDSQAAGDDDARQELAYLTSDKATAARAALHAQNLAVHTQDAATRMRDACVEQVTAQAKALEHDRGNCAMSVRMALYEAIGTLQSLTLDQVEQQQ